jgi:hypothetical protein
MILHFPAEIELTFPYRRLEDACGKVHSAFVFQRLWSDLGWQTMTHGKSGIYRAAYLPRFCSVMASLGVKDAAKSLSESGFIDVRENGDWFCPIFFHYNGHLDSSYVPPTLEWMNEWVKFTEKLEVNVLAFHKLIDETHWFLPNGDVIPESIMNRAIMVTHTLDIILRQSPRDWKTLPKATLQAACHIAQKHSAAKLAVILRRFLAVSRPRLNPLFPPTTEEALRDFEDLVILASPDEGMDAWIKRIEAKALTHEETPTEEAISAELRQHADQLSGIHPQPDPVGGGEPGPTGEAV